MTFYDAIANARKGIASTDYRFTHPDLNGYFVFTTDGKLSFYVTGYPAPVPGAQWPLFLSDFDRSDWVEGIPP